MADFNFIKPAPASISLQHSRGRKRGVRDSGLAADSRYVQGDLVFIDSADGAVKKVVQATPANLQPMAFAATSWDLGPFTGTRYANISTVTEVPVETMREGEQLVFTYQGNSANNANHTLTQAEADEIASGALREIIYNTDEKELTVRSTSTNPNCRLIRIFDDGKVGDTNVRVVVEILDAFRMVA